MRRRGIVILMLIAVLLSYSISARGADRPNGPRIIVENINASPGKMAEVLVRIENNPGIQGATLSIKWDEGLSLESVENGEVFQTFHTTFPKNLVSGKNYVWYRESPVSASEAIDGTILKLNFYVSEKVAYGQKLNVCVSCVDGDIFDSAMNTVLCSVQSGMVSVVKQEATASCSSALLLGDSISLEYRSDANVSDVTILLAAYLPNGQFYACDIRKVNLTAGTNALSFPNKSTDLNYKAFALRDGKPLCAAKQVVRAFTVVFKDYDGTVLSTQLVPLGEDAVLPEAPERSGYSFVGWLGDYTNVRSDLVITAQYKENTDPIIFIEPVDAEAGETIDVLIRIKNNPGVQGATLMIAWDEELTLKDVKNGEAFQSFSATFPKNLVSGKNYVWYSQTPVEPSQAADGTILTMRFHVPEDTPAGQQLHIRISCVDGDIFDKDFETLKLKIENGYINIK